MTKKNKNDESEHTAQEKTAPLAKHVKTAVMDYFEHLSDHGSEDLYTIVIREVERSMLEVTLEQTGYNQSQASKILGISRSTLRKKIAQYNIN